MSRKASSGPPPTGPAPDLPGRHGWLISLVFLALLALFFLTHLLTEQVPSFGYTELLSKVDTGQVVKISIDDKGAVKGNLRDGTFTTQLPTALADDQLLPRLRTLEEIRLRRPFWLAIVGIALFVGTAVIGFVRRKALHR